MLHLTPEVVHDLPSLLTIEEEENWHSKNIDYHPPHVERLWREWRDNIRVSLHRIFPCSPEEAFYHDHPWSSAMILLPESGSYLMGIGYSQTGERPPVAATCFMTPFSQYEITDSNGWHYVLR